MSPTQSPPLPTLPQAPPPPPAFGAIAPNSKKKPQSQQPSFLGTQASPTPGQLGNKTLLGA